MKKSELKQMILEELQSLNEDVIKIPSSKKDGDELTINVYPGREGFMVGSKLGGKVDRVYIEWEQLKKILKYKK